MKVLGIIPARYASSRLPAKPLADINGKPMIQHVYERALKAISEVIIATDDERIVKAVEAFGGKVVLTSAEHNTGTNRCLEAYQIYKSTNSTPFDVVVNIQGDEPMLEPEILNTLVSSFNDRNVEMATLTVKITDGNELFDENRVFLIMDKNGDALYFSRSPLPHVRGADRKDWMKHHPYYKHLGLYAYTPAALEEFSNMPPSALEIAESLEQNRWMEAGRKIRVQIVDHDSIPVDTPEDLERVRKLMKNLA